MVAPHTEQRRAISGSVIAFGAYWCFVLRTSCLVRCPWVVRLHQLNGQRTKLKVQSSNLTSQSQKRRSHPVHRIKEILALSVDAYSQFLTLAAQSLLEFRRTLLRARSIYDDDHRKLSLNYCLIDIDYAATSFREN